jgi:toxin ParE1/3/4
MATNSLRKHLQARLSNEALLDIDQALAYSIRQFGGLAGARYAKLMDAAVADLCQRPDRLGVKPFFEGHLTVMAYHLKHSNRRLTVTDRIGHPRHILFFRIQGDKLLISRVLHDAMDFVQHLMPKP